MRLLAGMALLVMWLLLLLVLRVLMVLVLVLAAGQDCGRTHRLGLLPRPFEALIVRVRQPRHEVGLLRRNPAALGGGEVAAGVRGGTVVAACIGALAHRRRPEGPHRQTVSDRMAGGSGKAVRKGWRLGCSPVAGRPQPVGRRSGSMITAAHIHRRCVVMLTTMRVVVVALMVAPRPRRPARRQPAGLFAHQICAAPEHRATAMPAF